MQIEVSQILEICPLKYKTSLMCNLSVRESITCSNHFVIL